MSGLVFTPTLRSAHGAGVGSGTRAAACLPTENSPRTAPLSPSGLLLSLRQVRSRLDRTPRAGLQLPPAAHGDVGHRLRRIALNSK